MDVNPFTCKTVDSQNGYKDLFGDTRDVAVVYLSCTYLYLSYMRYAPYVNCSREV